MKKAILLLFTLVFLTAPLYSAIDRKSEIVRLRGKLSDTDSRKDSIKILYDIFDLSNRKDYMSICRELDAVAAREGDIATRYDMARQMANVTRNDSVLALLEKHVESLPAGKDHAETLLFVKLRRLSANARYLSEKERRERVARIIVPDEDVPHDKYAKVERLFTICEYLSNFAKGDLLVEYLDDLGKMLREEGIDNYALKNIYYTECANIYSYTDNHEKAVAADRELLKTIDALEKRYKAQGRKYRNYDVSRFIVYRRMLSNYKELSLDEVNDLYVKVLQLVENNEDVRNEYNQHKRSAAYHAMKNERYAEAIPYIKRQLSTGGSQALMKRMLEMLRDAALQIGDRLNVDFAERELESLMAEYNTNEAKERFNELKIRYDVSALRAENAELELRNQNGKLSATRRLMVFVVVGWVAFALMLFAVIFFWARYKRTRAEIGSFVDGLVAERNAIKKRRYYDYAKKNGAVVKPEAYKSAPPKNGNVSDIMDYIINDVMFISSVALEDARKFRQTVSVKSFMESSVDTLTSDLKKNININVIYPDPDFEIRVDRQCLQMLVDHILKLAARLAPEGGSVGFECHEDKHSNMARFVFRHTGNSLPEGQEERVFEHFFDYKKLSKSGESALIMCRMINFLTNSSLKSSAGHTPGGQLVLIVPMS